MPQPASTAGPREVFEQVLREIENTEIENTEIENTEIENTEIENTEMDAYADLFAADGTFESPFAPPPLPRRIEGREAIRAFFRAAAEGLRAAPPQFRFSSVVVHETVDPAVIVTEYEVQGVSAGGPYQFSNLGVMTVRNGEIVSLRDYWSPLDRPELAALTNHLAAPPPRLD